ncbi:hypothetical protein BDV41DRAFT_574576 [Aspergillus transmontanensis]|uniref:Heterokaryon incompatibility domain-containing protein n=1 Tax=Aspergillus transmontanensis TaxID=1034304 RepID=A0A5N6W414_9EURO|nr:hypothetical protein BDV41DRAFT_574576 [Aspergillus transmontanensis]
MSWAATRNYATSDAVHSLKGMFNVSMTRKINESMSDAFHRLQVILIQSYSYDLSIFAWTDETRLHSRDILLANSPSEFASCSQIELVKGDWDATIDPIRDEYAILDVLLQFPGNDQKYLLCLNCSYKSSGLQLPGIAIWVRLNTDTGYLERINLTKTEVWEGTSTTEPVTVESSGRVKTGALV